MIDEKLLFPTTIIEDFYPDPDKIRDFANSLDYLPTSGRYPGRKSAGFTLLDNKDFHQYTCEKFMSIYYDYLNYIEWDIHSEFRIIDPLHKDINHPINYGFVHQDGNCVLAGICYLNPIPNPDSGTSFYIKTKHIEDSNTKIAKTQSIRFDAYTSNGLNYDEELFKLNFKENKDLFEEILTVKNRYNRLIAFDANHWHASNTILCNNQPRLIQLFFVKSINSKSKPPYMRIRDIG